MSDEVAKRSDEFHAAEIDSSLVRTLMQGSKGMRDAGQKYLPMEEGESISSYSKRLARTDLYNAYRKTVNDLTGRIFIEPIILKEDVPQQIQAWSENINMAGQHINEFAADIFKDGLQTGVSYILVDSPNIQNATRAQEISGGVRPYWTHLRLENIIGIKTNIIDGKQALDQVRISEFVKENYGDYGQKNVEQIRVLNRFPATFEIWRQNDKQEWVLVDQGFRGIEEIPLVPFYANRTSFMMGRPPLQELAELNLTHWQSSSDQRNILHYARVPILFATGMEMDAKIPLSSDKAIVAVNENANLRWVEHSGNAINAGRQDLVDLETRMQSVGLQMLIDGVAKTATGEKKEDIKEISHLTKMARSLQDALENALEYTAIIGGLGEAGGSVEINTDFGLDKISAQELNILLTAVNTGNLSRDTFIKELIRGGIISEDVDPEIELEMIDGSGDGLN